MLQAVISCFLHLFILAVSSTCPSQILPISCISKNDYSCTFGLLGDKHQDIDSEFEPREIHFTEKLYGKMIQSKVTWKAPLKHKVPGFLIILVNSTWQEYFFYNLSQEDFLFNNSEIIFTFACEKDIKSSFYICLGGKNCHLASVPSVSTTTTTTTTTQTIREINTLYPVADQTIIMNLPTKKKSFIWFYIVGAIFLLLLVLAFLLILKWYVSTKRPNMNSVVRSNSGLYPLQKHEESECEDNKDNNMSVLMEAINYTNDRR